MSPAVMIVHERAHDFRDMLESRFPSIAFSYVTRPVELATSLERVGPEVVFSIKSPNFPPAAHRPIVDCPSVRWLQIGGSGYEHVWPWDTARLTVTNCAGVLARHLAETVTGAMIALNGNLLTYARQQRERTWEPHLFRPLSQQTILIVGLGHIGRRVADNTKALGMRVLALRRQQIDHPSVDQVAPPGELPRLLGEADVVSLHLRATAETNQLFDGNMLSKIKRGALFLNTSRGSIVDQGALIRALESKQLRGAYLDVFQEEPLPIQSPLWSMPHVLITPHAADNISEWALQFADYFADNLQRWTSGNPLVNRVDTD